MDHPTYARNSRVAIFPGLSQLGVSRMSKLFARFLNDESGATAIEYGLIAAGISLAIIAAVNGIGGNLSTKFGDINTSLK
jgi:pilus assembly protein Flp/PilA